MLENIKKEKQQQWCPLEHTMYEGYCFNEFNNVRLRTGATCEFSLTCLNLKNTLDAYEIDNQ